MGFLDSIKGNQMGMKAYRLHVSALQHRKQGRYAESQRELDEAFEQYNKAYAAGFRKPSQMLAYGILTMQRGDFERARELMLEVNKDKSLSKEDRFTLRLNFSICQWKMGRVDKAIETLRSASKNMNGAIYNTLGMYLVDQARRTGDFEEVLRFNREAMDYDDEDASTLDNMGTLCLIMSDKSREEGNAEQAAAQREEAYGYFVKAHEAQADQVTSIFYLAKLEHERGNDARARELIGQAKKIPTTALCPVSPASFEALEKEIG